MFFVKKNKYRYGLFVIALLFYSAGVSVADTLSISDVSPTKSAVETVFVNTDTACAYGRDEIISFADELYSLGEYDRAAVEYLRFAFLYPNDSCADAALFKAGLCREKAGDLEQARKIYTLLGQSPNSRSKEFAAYRVALSYLLEENYDSARAVLDSVPNRGAAEYLRGWILMGQQKYAEAVKTFSSLAQNSDSSDVGGSLNYLLTRARQGEKIPYRSPFVAGLLSAIVPGLGRAYCGRWDDGLFSLIVVGVPASLAYTTYEKDKTFSAVMAAFAGFFYLGNIYGSAKGAKIYNIQRRQKFWKLTWEQVPHPPTMLYSAYPCGGE